MKTERKNMYRIPVILCCFFIICQLLVGCKNTPLKDLDNYSIAYQVVTKTSTKMENIDNIVMAETVSNTFSSTSNNVMAVKPQYPPHVTMDRGCAPQP